MQAKPSVDSVNRQTRRTMTRLAAITMVALGSVLATSAAQAGGIVSWSVSVGTPVTSAPPAQARFFPVSPGQPYLYGPGGVYYQPGPVVDGSTESFYTPAPVYIGPSLPPGLQPAPVWVRPRPIFYQQAPVVVRPWAGHDRRDDWRHRDGDHNGRRW